jgi:dipeptidyl aminopeptidase/acylaminoacyl peptidase
MVSFVHREEVVTARLEGSAKEVRILRTPGIASLAWAPDGVRLVVTTWVHKDVGRERGVPRTEAWLVKSDGSGRARLPVPETHVVLDWSRDGKFLLTWVPPRTQPRAEAPNFPSVLYTMGVDGTRVTRVTVDGENSHYGRISPDSTAIAYCTSGGEAFPNLRYGLSIVKSNGAGRREIMHESTAGVPVHMCWCPDGKHLAVQIHQWQKDSLGRITFAGSHIEIYDLGGNRLRTLAPKDAKFSEDSSLDWQ